MSDHESTRLESGGHRGVAVKVESPKSWSRAFVFIVYMRNGQHSSPVTTRKTKTRAWLCLCLAGIRIARRCTSGSFRPPPGWEMEFRIAHSDDAIPEQQGRSAREKKSKRADGKHRPHIVATSASTRENTVPDVTVRAVIQQPPQLLVPRRWVSILHFFRSGSKY